MLENFSSNTELKFKELSPEEKERRGILGRLYGPIADILKSTRNGRRYTESLWEKVFVNPITKEMFEQGGIPGEMDHPVDREETCSEKIAIMMPEPPTKDREGRLMGYFDILDTPCGRIAYALAKYGFNLGISSRGTGDTYIDDNGEETVDEDTYSFNAFDLVLLPACKDARLKLAESFDNKKIKFNNAIQEVLNSSDEGERKIIKETLENLKFYEDTPPENKGEEDPIVDNDNDVADNDGTELVQSLQEALTENQDLHKQVMELQEKLSVSYTKEIRLERHITKLKEAVSNLTESVNRSKAIENQAKTLKTQLEDSVKRVNQQDELIESLRSDLLSSRDYRRKLNENVNSKNQTISELNRKVNKLNEAVQTLNREKLEESRRLSDQISELKKDSEIRNTQYSKKVAKCNSMVESYKKIARQSLDRYIECKATTLGVSTNEIKNKLSENYSFNEIDSVCEELRSYKRNISKLPFNISNVDINRVALKEDKSTKKFTNPDDDVDPSLINLLNN